MGESVLSIYVAMREKGNVCKRKKRMGLDFNTLLLKIYIMII